MSERKVFTYKDVEEAKKYIGKRGMFSDNFKEISEGMGYSGDLDNPFKKDCVGAWCPFFCISGSAGGGIGYQFFSPDPEPVEKWVPFTVNDAPLFIGRAIRFKKSPEDGCRLITSAAKLDVFANQWKTYIELIDLWEFTDGTPCGKKVTE